MKTLVLCVDRDDDMGEKASIISPIIGRQENLDAAVALALVDPEDSDVNTSMAGIRIYDELKREGRPVEVVTICGDKKVGKRSDEVIATQLDIVIKEIEPSGVILVSDGAEDEFIIPLVTSRITVNSVERVVVKQRKSIEDTYYLITRLMSDDKIQKKFMLPVALLLFFWGISSVLAAFETIPDIGIATILVFIGVYLIVRIYHLEEGVVRFARDFRAGVEKGYISTFTGIIALILVVVAIVRATLELPDSQNMLIESTVIILSNSLWFIIAAGGLYTIGRLLDIYIRKGYLVSSIILTLFSIISFGLVMMAGIDILKYYIGMTTGVPNIWGTLGWFGLAVLIFIVGRIPYNYARTSKRIVAKLKY